MKCGMAEWSVFVPGHITAFFTPLPHEDPVRAGSTGAGITISRGVEVCVEPADATRLILNADEQQIAPVVGALEELDVQATVKITSELPLGTGFGISGAATLGSVLGANHIFDCGLTENDAIEIAHRAEVRAGTGLGDVVAQARGGMPIRWKPGGPSVNEIDAIPEAHRIEYVTFGTLSTADVLRESAGSITPAGERALAALRDNPSSERLMNAARQFASESGLLTDQLGTVIDRVEAAGGQASMAMLGRTVFALGTGLSDAGYDPVVCRTHGGGPEYRWNSGSQSKG